MIGPMRPLTPLYDPVTRHGRKPPVPIAYSLASGALTDGRDTAAGTGVSYAPGAQIQEWFEDFQGITPGAAIATSADWSDSGATPNRWYANASGAATIITTSDTTASHQTALSAGSKYVLVKGIRGGTRISLRGYSFGVYFYNSPSTSWYRVMREGSSYRPASFNVSQTPGNDVAVDMLCEAIVEGVNVRYRMTIDDVLWDEYLDTTPPADSFGVGLYGNGRGTSPLCRVASIEAGRLI